MSCANVLIGFISPVLAQETITPQITFACENNNGVPITVAKDQKSQTQTIFHWKEEALKDKTLLTPQELCDDVSKRLNDVSIDGDDLSSVGFVATHVSSLSAICMNAGRGRSRDCSKLLFTFIAQDEHPSEAAYHVLNEIIDPEIIQAHREKNRFSERYYLGYTVDFS